jgi:hypothetical protein
MAKKVRGESHPKPKRASWPASRDEETPEDRAHLDAKLAHQFAEFARLDAKAAPLIVEAERVVEDMTLCATSSAPAAARRAAARRLGRYVPVRLLPEERQALGRPSNTDGSLLAKYPPAFFGVTRSLWRDGERSAYAGSDERTAAMKSVIAIGLWSTAETPSALAAFNARPLPDMAMMPTSAPTS